MDRSDKREIANPRLQEAYWNALSGEYARITRIDAGDFHYGPQIPGESTLQLLPEFSSGATSLELGCGGAQNSIWLARRGLKCTAFDISGEQLRHAEALARECGVTVDLRRASLEDFESALEPGEAFDFVHSSHALEFVDNPAPVIRAMAAHTKSGGTVMVSTVHPLFNGEWIDGTFEDEDGEVAGDSVPGVFLTDYFSPPDDIRDDGYGHAVSRAWPVSAWFDWFREAGLRVVALAEPRAVRDAPYTSDDWANHGGQLDRIPSTLILVGEKP